MSYYCPNCGAKHEAIVRPNYCGHCGGSMIPGQKAKQSSSQETKPHDVPEAVPENVKFDLNIEPNESSRKFTIEDAINGRIEKGSAVPRVKRSKEENLRLIQQERAKKGFTDIVE